MSKKKPKNKQQPKKNQEYDAQMKALHDAWEKEDAERKKRLAVKKPGEFMPDYVCVDGQFWGMPPEVQELDNLGLSEAEKYRRWNEIMHQAEKESENQRNMFALYYCEGGNTYPFGEFTGHAIKVEKHRILFQRIWMKYDLMDYECTTREGTEDHVWIYDCKPFKDAGITVGKCCRFNACVYAYKRANGTVDFGLKCPENIELIQRYELPDMKMVSIRDGIRSAEQLVCETCMFTEQCYEKGSPVCVAADGYREERTKQIFFSSQENLSQARELIIDYYKLSDYGYLGALMADLSKDTVPGHEGQKGIMITACPAAPESDKDRLNPEDILLEIDGITINTMGDVCRAISGKQGGSTVTIKRLPCGAMEPETVTWTLLNQDQMADFYIGLMSLDELADLADKAAHHDLKEAV